MSKLLEISLQEFKFGNTDQTLLNILGSSSLLKIEQKFADVDIVKLYISLRELSRYLFLATHSSRSIFFPGDRLMDDLWHVLILETAEYRNICSKMRPGSFIDHTGVLFEDYLSQHDYQSIHQEQNSWLISYIKNFGPIEFEAFECLTLAQSLASHADMNLNELNDFGMSLLLVANSLETKVFCKEQFLERLFDSRNEVDSNPALLRSLLKELLDGLNGSVPEFSGLPPNSLLEEMFSASTAFAFVLWQHLAVVERLSGMPEWQLANQALWINIKKGTSICGLATTHLAKPGGSSLKSIVANDGFLLSGNSPWVCGKQIFDYLLIGFETSDSIVFALVLFPDMETNCISIAPASMICLNGTGTVYIEFKNFFISLESVVSQRVKTEKVLPRSSSYIIPELGIGKKALKMTQQAASQNSHPRQQFVQDAALILQNRLKLIEQLRDERAVMDTLIPLRDDFNRDAIRLFSFSIGSQSMNEGSLVSRWTLEMIFIDSLIHSPKALEIKILGTGGRHDCSST